MKTRYKRYLKIYLIPIVFITTSFIFTTFAWFAYSGLKRVSTEIDVKAWYIELTKSGEVVTNNIVISLNDVYPGMETVDELVNIENKGDSDAKLSYKITSSRILNTEVNGETLNDNRMLSDSLAHDYPFHVNINLSKNYIEAGGDTSTFEVSVSWPLDSGNDALDSTWGMNSYNFQQGEQTRLANDPNYSQRPAVQIVISVMAEQFVEEPTASDKRYNAGDIVLYDVQLNRRCTTLSETCISTNVIDYNNTLGDNTVTLLPSLYNTYMTSTFANYNTTLDTYTSNWTAPTRALTASDILKLVSHDVTNSMLNANNISPQIIGNLEYSNRASTEISKAVSLNGYYTFLNNKYSYFVHSGCYWTTTPYNSELGFAFGKLNDLKTEIYGKNKSDECRVVPVIIAPKSNL